MIHIHNIEYYAIVRKSNMKVKDLGEGRKYEPANAARGV